MLTQELKTSMNLHPLLTLLFIVPNCHQGQEPFEPTNGLLSTFYCFMTRVESAALSLFHFGKCKVKLSPAQPASHAYILEQLPGKGRKEFLGNTKIIVFYYKEFEENGN